MNDFLAAEQRLYRSLSLETKDRMLNVELPSGVLGIRVVEIGPKDGRPVVWVHGGGGVGAQFAALVAAVEARAPGALRHVILDRPGCGGSDPFLYWDVGDLRAHAVACLRGVLDGLSIDRAGFVGNSMGGLWSLWLGTDLPSRVDGLVMVGVPAVLFGTSAPFPMRLCSTPWIGRRLMRMGPVAEKDAMRAQAAEVWKRLGHPDRARIPNELLDLAAAAARIPHWTESFVSLIHEVLGWTGPRITFEESEWKRLLPPVHLVWGSADPFGSTRAAERAIAVKPEAKLSLIAGAGHCPWLDDVETCARAVTSMFGERKASLIQASV